MVGGKAVDHGGLELSRSHAPAMPCLAALLSLSACYCSHSVENVDVGPEEVDAADVTQADDALLADDAAPDAVGCIAGGVWSGTTPLGPVPSASCGYAFYVGAWCDPRLHLFLGTEMNTSSQPNRSEYLEIQLMPSVDWYSSPEPEGQLSAEVIHVRGDERASTAAIFEVERIDTPPSTRTGARVVGTVSVHVDGWSLETQVDATFLLADSCS